MTCIHPADNARILIAGATSDMAQALIPRLIESPVTLGLHGRNSMDRLEPFVGGGSGATVKAFSAELDSGDTARSLVDEFCDWAGGIDCLIQFTGNINRVCAWDDLDPEDWNADLAVNLTAPFFLAQAAIRHMSDEGRIVLMSTASASRSCGATTLGYGVAKAGIEAVVRSLAKACAPRGILVNAVCPGLIETRFHADTAKRSPADIAKRAESVPLGSAGTADDIAAAVLFLISTENRFTTGQCLRIDGGDFI
jgi:3-oxoacyl-[acyl-carrier protein] reductase